MSVFIAVFFCQWKIHIEFCTIYLLHLQKVQKYIAMVDVLQVPGPEACTSTTEFLKQFFIVDFASVSFFEAVCNCKVETVWRLFVCSSRCDFQPNVEDDGMMYVTQNGLFLPLTRAL